jgi:hypothetical protein
MRRSGGGERTTEDAIPEEPHRLRVLRRGRLRDGRERAGTLERRKRAVSGDRARHARARAPRAKPRHRALESRLFDENTLLFLPVFFSLRNRNREDDPDYGYDWEPYYG